MQTYLKISVITLFFILGVVSLAFCAEDEGETFTITTYYPSPYGSYNELTTYSNTYLAIKSGNVGIGTTAPQVKFTVASASPKATAAITNVGWFGSSDAWVASLGFYIREIGSATAANQSMSIGAYDNAVGGRNLILQELGGNVGIGTASPGTNKLEVVGGPIKATSGLIIETRTSDPASPVTGQMWLRTDI